MYTLVRYIDAKIIRWAVAHAVACAILVDIRIVGLVGAFRMLKTGLKPHASRAATAALVVIVVFGLANVVRIMVRYHPYEHLYFNALTGGTHGADGRYDLDYWGLFYRQGLGRECT